MTMKDLARICNVSLSTVSKAFNDAKDISSETRNFIFETAKKYGCFGKFYRGKYHQKVIAVICPELNSGYYSSILSRLQDLIEASGAICLISADNFSVKKQQNLLEYYCSYLQVDGCIVFYLNHTPKKGYDIPIVAVFSNTDYCDSVSTDTEFAMQEVVNTLYTYGHKDLCFIGDPLTKTKALLFRKAITKGTCTVIESSQRFEAAGVDGIEQLMECKAPFTAVICAYDNIAYGAMRQLQKLGYRIPEDVSVVGINNLNTSHYTQTSLSTIDVTAENICAITWELLENKLKQKPFRARQNIVVKPRLIIRESIGSAKK